MKSTGTTPYIIAVCGLKNCGKTTFVVGLIKELKQLGLRVAAFKHVAHDFICDTNGTDSWRFSEAGAESVAVYSGHRYMFIKEEPGKPEDLIHLAGDCDIIVIEGGKNLPYPKIAIVREGISAEPVTRENLIAVATDTGYTDPDVTTIDLNDHKAAADIIAACLI